MSRVGGSGPGSDGASFASDDRLRDFDGRRHRFSDDRTTAKDAGLERGMHFGRFDLAGGLADGRETEFLEKVRRALGEARMDQDPQEDRSQLRLLAIAGESAALAAGAAAVTIEADANVSGPDRAAQVGSLVDRVERSLDAALSGRKQEFSLRLDLPDAGDGIGGLAITLSPDAIDLVLTRTGGAATADYLLAAQALADRLQTRFSRRTVRVLEIEPAPEAKQAHGLEAISRLLTNPGVRS